MSVSYPSSVVNFRSNVGYYTVDGEVYRSDGRIGIPASDTWSKADVPSLFKEKKFSEKGNNVHHVKALGVDLKVSGYPLLNGLIRTSGKSPTSLTMEYHRMHGAALDTIYMSMGCQPRYGYCYWTCQYARHKFDGLRGNTQGYYLLDSGMTMTVQVLNSGIVKILTQRNDGGYSSSDFSEFCDNFYAVVPKIYYSSVPDYQYFADCLDTMAYISAFDSGTIFSRSYASILSVTAILPSDSLLSTATVLSEDDLIFGSGIGEPYSAYHVKALMQESYLDALDHVPQLNENSLSNILELVSFLKALILDHRVEIPNSLQSAWLSYRYSYTTSKLDMQEAVNFVYRNVDKEFLRRGFSCYGTSSNTIKGVNVVAKCRIDVKQKELAYLDKIFTGLYRYGLSPSFYVIWDMIPYSFIVDWFIPVGDILSGYDKSHMYDRTYDISNVWYSLSYTNFTEDNVECSVYTRWGGSSPPEFNGYYTLDNKGTTSNRVIGFRILDALSLFIR